MTILFTDPHIGLNRVANTTPASRIKLREAVYAAALNIVDPDRLFPTEDERICLGDLFDRYSNPEDVLLQGAAVLAKTDLCLAGNHDVISAKDRTGSLAFLDQTVAPLTVVTNNFGTAGHRTHINDQCIYLAVPHCTTQDLFEESLQQALDMLQPGFTPKGGRVFLLLHCNYDSPYADGETELNLTQDDAAYLLENGIDYIVTGHEHNPREDLNGRVIVLGNTHPTGFSDISDKRVMVVDDATGAFHFETLWTCADHYVEATVESLSEDGYPTTSFIKVTGFCTIEGAKNLTRKVRACWDKSPHLLGLKVDVQMEGLEGLSTDTTESLSDLPSLISAELKGTAAAELWETLLKEVTEES